ncbi:MAG: 2-oxoacid ferredoxin oxidoreductase [Nitrospinae bacterium RIFCSPLOWO2_02_39_17]|nr:MAG: 2-oxoacid ferredoxin oxidoreductase [Nitrospinae bacterium RIFCSPLOWO2_02_39_17]
MENPVVSEANLINPFHYEGELSWCPGCGDFQILKSVEKALTSLNKKPSEVVLVSGIGQAAKLPHYMKANGFNGLHGRALPPAFGIKSFNRNLTVLVTTGDGDCYGEGGNHLIHAIRRNIDITVIVHNNQVYGLTKGQASPTSEVGMVTKTQPFGVVSLPFNPIAFAIAMDTPFVARSFSKDIDFTSELIKQGIETKGFALIDILQPCVSFNKINTYQWYSQRAYKLDNNYDPTNRVKAFEKSLEWGDKIPMGVIYRSQRPTYDETLDRLGIRPQVNNQPDLSKVKSLLNEF